MKNIIVIPIFIGHASRFVQICLNLAQVDLSGVDVAFMVSSPEEENYFRRLVAPLLPSVIIIDSQKIIAQKGESSRLRLAANEERSAINLKKMAGLQYAKENHYDYAACLDSDIYLLPQFNAQQFFELAIKNYQKSEYFGVTVDHPAFKAPFQKTLVLFAKDKSVADLLPAMEAWFPWFFDVPLYSLKDYSEFDAYMSGQWGEWYLQINWFTFDHLMFIAWKILKAGSKLIDYGNITTTIPELLSNVELKEIERVYQYEPAWLTATNFVYFPEIVNQKPHIKLLNHADRVNDVKFNS